MTENQVEGSDVPDYLDRPCAHCGSLCAPGPLCGSPACEAALERLANATSATSGGEGMREGRG